MQKTQDAGCCSQHNCRILVQHQSRTARQSNSRMALPIAHGSLVSATFSPISRALPPSAPCVQRDGRQGSKQPRSCPLASFDQLVRPTPNLETNENHHCGCPPSHDNINILL
ncbi:hypothetical protein IG631_23131 [Alternaria alternata]|nr:hypothetical protein IG631_23131 [Alternaria alternata]